MPSPTQHEIVIVGAGPAGLGAAIKLRQAGFTDFAILERADDFGGTWRDCVYPGLMCDIPALTYSYSYAQKPDWTSLWAPQEEILAYLHGVVERFGIRPHARFGTTVEGARWDADANRWTVTTAGGDEYVARYVINASGYLSVARWPEIPGLEDYRGRRIHTSEWPRDADLGGRRIALIGTGATGIQLAPELAPAAEQLSVFQRTPIWLLPKVPLPVPKPLQFAFRRIPLVQRGLRLMTAAFMDLVFWRAFTDYGQVRRLARFVEKQGRNHVRRQVDDPETAEALTPRYSWGCKRPSFSNAFYPIFNRENVELVTDPIERFTETGIVTADGREHEFDVIVCATGYQPFEPGSLPTYPVHGRDDVELTAFWQEHRYQAFRGFAVHGFPNYFLVYGPYAVASTSYFAMIEREVENIVRVLRAGRRDGADYVEVRRASQEQDFRAVLEGKRTAIWNVADCGSSNTFYLNRHQDTPLFRPTYHPGEWRRARTLPVRRHFDLERRDPADGADRGRTATDDTPAGIGS